MRLMTASMETTHSQTVTVGANGSDILATHVRHDSDARSKRPTETEGVSRPMAMRCRSDAFSAPKTRRLNAKNPHAAVGKEPEERAGFSVPHSGGECPWPARSWFPTAPMPQRVVETVLQQLSRSARAYGRSLDYGRSNDCGADWRVYEAT